VTSQPAERTPAALAARILEVVSEIRAELESDRWVLIPSDATVAVAHAAVGLSHACALSEEIVAAHERDAEIVARTLARSLFETWVVSYYIHHGGYDALKAVAGSYYHSIALQHRVITEYDARLTKERQQARRRNKKIDAANSGIREWNRRNPDATPKTQHDPLPEPPGVLVNWDDIAWLKDVPNEAPTPLALTEMIERLRKLTRAAGQEEIFEVSYHLAYRGLSNFGAHTNLFVLNAYLDNRDGQGNFLRVRNTATVPGSFVLPNLNTALLLLAGLAIAVLGDRGADCVAAKAAMETMKDRHAISGNDGTTVGSG
jgi:hypothetical protein